MIKNILFDMDDTLLDFRLAEKTALTKTLQHLNIEPKKEILARYSELNLDQWKLLEQKKLTLDEVKVQRYKLLFEEFNIKISAEYATQYYERCLAKGHFFIDGAEKLLSDLFPSYRLYLASNGSVAVQKSRIKSAGIEKYFDNIFISEQVGFEKPCLNFFEYCFSKISNFNKNETLIIGDSLSSDIAGGNKAGITTVWFNKNGLENLSDTTADYEISSLSDFASLLKSI